MTKKLTKSSLFSFAYHSCPSQNRAAAEGHAVWHGFGLHATTAALVLVLLIASFSSVAEAKGKTDKFHGTLVAAGPKAITVKSRDNIYSVRTFNYSPQLEKKIPHKHLSPGKKVTVHYLRGTDQATQVD